MKKLLLTFAMLLMLFFQTNKLYSQGAVSGDGLYIASIVKENFKNIIVIHKFMTKELVRKFEITNQITINEIAFSYSGKYLYIKQGETFTFYDVPLDRLLITYTANKVLLTKNDDFFYSIYGTTIKKVDIETGTAITTYTTPSGKKYNNFILSPTEDFFAALTSDKVCIYDVKEPIYLKEFSGIDVKFRNNGSSVVVFSIFNEIVRISTYKLPTLFQEKNITSDFLLQPVSPGGKLFPTRCSLSSDGQLVALYTAHGVKVEIYIFHTISTNLLWTINNFANTSNELFPQVWTNYNTMIGYGAELMAGEYDILNRKSTPLGLRIDNFTESPFLSQENQLSNRKFSQDYHYVAIQAGRTLYVRDSRIPNKRALYQDVEFLAFTPDCKYIIVKKDETVNVIVAEQLTASLNSNTVAKLYTFDKLIKAPQSEAIIANDAKPPHGYGYFYVNNTKQIVKVDTSNLKITLRSLKVNNNEVELQVNLVDANGNLFLGATDPSWSFIWCNLLLQHPDGTVTQVNDFVVEEVSENAPTAYSLVLDHSGSMGVQRANDLQNGAWQLINTKKPEDAYMLIKYDNRPRIMFNFTKDKNVCSKFLNYNGLDGFGGATALIDAAYLAVLKLQKLDNFQKKSIILFTDGYENSSFYTLNDLLTVAKNSNVQINVIGFGNEINEKFLNQIAYNTGGIYIHLYDTKQLKNVFKDVDIKRRNYYTVKFKTPTTGKHIAFLQLCQDLKNHDSLWVPFDNKVEKKNLVDINLVSPINPKEVKLTQFEKLKIPTNPILKPVESKNVLKDFGEITFPNINFATSSDKILSSDQNGIQEIVNFMRKYPNVFLEINGHTDNLGTKEFNMTLSINRAEAAKKLIVDKGVGPGRIVVRGYGDTKPLESNETEQGRAKNRRIEFYIFVQ